MINQNNVFNESIFLFFIIFTFLFSFLMLFISYFLGGSYNNFNKNVPFESGAPDTGGVDLNFSVKFYLIAIFFVIFDVEALYLYLWSLNVRENGWLGFMEILFFILMIFLSLLYILKGKEFIWNSNKSKK